MFNREALKQIAQTKVDIGFYLEMGEKILSYKGEENEEFKNFKEEFEQVTLDLQSQIQFVRHALGFQP